jgi:hypothetical protein
MPFLSAFWVKSLLDRGDNLKTLSRIVSIMINCPKMPWKEVLLDNAYKYSEGNKINISSATDNLMSDVPPFSEPFSIFNRLKLYLHQSLALEKNMLTFSLKIIIFSTCSHYSQARSLQRLRRWRLNDISSRSFFLLPHLIFSLFSILLLMCPCPMKVFTQILETVCLKDQS